MQMLRFTQHDNSMSVILNNVKDLAHIHAQRQEEDYGNSCRQ